MSDLKTTTTGRSWMLKQLGIGLMFLAFGVWGYLDATVVYPNRGERSTEYLKFQYLQQAKREMASGAQWPAMSVEDPVGEFAKLAKTDRGSLSSLELARRDWLESLSIIGKLGRDRTTVANPQSEFDKLSAEFTNLAGAPKPLAGYDIPVQWLIFAIGTGVGVVMLGILFAVSRVRYKWDAASLTLHLPDGATLNVADCEDFDRRKWDKFLMFIKVKPGHPSLGGREIKLDLYRYVPLEDWVVEMEYTAFPDRRPQADEPVPLPTEPESPASAAG